MAGLRWVNSPSRRKPERRFERVRGGQKKLPHRLARIFAKPPDPYCTQKSATRNYCNDHKYRADEHCELIR